MILPDIALQTAVRAKLIASPAVAQYVTPERIRAGSIRPDDLPAIVLAPARISILGYAAGHQIVGEVRSMIHVWAVEDGTEAPYQIASGAMAALIDAPRGDSFQIDEWDRPNLVWIPDVQAEVTHAHAVIGLRAAIRWDVSQ